MKEGFESKFSSIQTDMVSICLEYIEDKGDRIFIYASNEKKCIVCNYFFEIDGVLYKKHKLPEGYNVSIDRQKGCMNVLNQDMEELEKLCNDNDVDVPTELKIIYDLRKNKLESQIKYENVYSNSEKTAIQISDEWFNEINSSI